MWIDEDIIRDCHLPRALNIFRPDKNIVVLGRSNDGDIELNRAHCDSKKIPILRRIGGGGTVLLHSGCLILSLGMWVKDYYRNDFFLRGLNNSIKRVIERIKPGIEIQQKGISDLCMGEQKFVGTSLFRSRNFLLFQASLLYEARADEIEFYLKHPSIEPSYRSGRNHKEFLVGLSEHLERISIQELSQNFENHWDREITTEFLADFCDPIAPQVNDLKTRFIKASL